MNAVKNNVAGSFQAAVLSGVLGAGKPEQETAKNTKKMVDLQEDVIREIRRSRARYT